jgi:hypothetical protein
MQLDFQLFGDARYSFHRIQLTDSVIDLNSVNAGILFYDSSARETHALWEITVTVLAMICLLGSMILVAVMVYRDVQHEEAMSSVQQRMRQGIMAVLDLHAPSFDFGHAAAMKAPNAAKGLAMIKTVQRLIKFGGRLSSSSSLSGEESSLAVLEGSQHAPRRPSAFQREKTWTGVKSVIEEQPLELHRTVDTGTVERWLSYLKDGSSEHESRDMPTELMKMVKESQPNVLSHVGSLLDRGRRRTDYTDVLPSQMTLTGDDMPPKAQVGMIRFWLANHWMNAALADTSPVSHYSVQPESVFFGNLVDDNPYLLDHMLNANEEEFAKIKVGPDFTLNTAQSNV